MPRTVQTPLAAAVRALELLRKRRDRQIDKVTELDRQIEAARQRVRDLAEE